MAFRRSSAERHEEGFTLIELMVATLIMSVIVICMAEVLTNSLIDAASSRQRVQAVYLANQTVSEVRSLASTSTGWQTYLLGSQGGLKASDPDAAATPSTDPNISNGCFEGQPLDIGGSLAGTGSCAGQSTVWQDRSTCTSTTSPPDAGSLSPPQPLQPHEACFLLNNTTYIVDAYVTGTNTGASSTPVSTALAAGHPLVLTVVVSWTKPLRGHVQTGADRVSTTTDLDGCSVQVPCT